MGTSTPTALRREHPEYAEHASAGTCEETSRRTEWKIDDERFLLNFPEWGWQIYVPGITRARPRVIKTS